MKKEGFFSIIVQSLPIISGSVVLILNPSLITCVTFGKLVLISDFQSFICEIRKIILITVRCIKYLASSLVPSQPLTSGNFRLVIKVLSPLSKPPQHPGTERMLFPSDP